MLLYSFDRSRMDIRLAFNQVYEVVKKYELVEGEGKRVDK